MKPVRGAVLLLGAGWMTAAAFGQGFDFFGQSNKQLGLDLSGIWDLRPGEDTTPAGSLVDYEGIPLNEAGRLYALSFNASQMTLREEQCAGYVPPYFYRSIGNYRYWEERDPHTEQLVAIKTYGQITEGTRTFWMDGRPHPPAYAPHTWAGFSTGKWQGNILSVYTTHIKRGFIRANGVAQSDEATLEEHFIRHGDRITYFTVINDPVNLAEPMSRTVTFLRKAEDPGAWLYACDDGEQILSRSHDPTEVPYYSWGQHPFLREYSDRYKVPLLASLGGAETMYPEFAAKLKDAASADAAANAEVVPARGPERVSVAADPDPHDGEIHVLPVQGNLYMLVGDGANIAVQVGDEGPLVVDAGTGKLADQVLAAIRKLSNHPIQFIVNTSSHSDHTGGNLKLHAAGEDPSLYGSFFSGQFADAGQGATIIGQQNVQDRMIAIDEKKGVKGSSEAYPTDTYIEGRRRKYHNGEAIEIFYEPNAITDGDSIVQFRRSDVIATGDIFTTTQYPFIDVNNGGSVEGEIRALNNILDKTVYQHDEEGGTMIIPGHGRLCDESEVADYRNMIVIIRDRVRDMLNKGASLDQVKAARVTADYDTRYGAASGPWPTDDFVTAVYTSLKKTSVNGK
jgi:cyclase